MFPGTASFFFDYYRKQQQLIAFFKKQFPFSAISSKLTYINLYALRHVLSKFQLPLVTFFRNNSNTAKAYPEAVFQRCS